MHHASGKPHSGTRPSGTDRSTWSSASRSFYTALGHFPLAWELPVYLRHLAGGLAWLEESA